VHQDGAPEDGGKKASAYECRLPAGVFPARANLRPARMPALADFGREHRQEGERIVAEAPCRLRPKRLPGEASPARKVFREPCGPGWQHGAVNIRVRLFLALAVILTIAILAGKWHRDHLEAGQDKFILASASKHGVDPALVKAVIWRESRFRPEARGGKGEAGLMQIMENTGLEWAGAQRIRLNSQAELLDPARNIECGTWYLRKLLGRYQQTDDPVPYALADYNAGRGNVLKWMKESAVTNSADFVAKIGFPSTSNYVLAVMERRQRYAQEFLAAQARAAVSPP
jgi:soluble lytic murein transglycosylase